MTGSNTYEISREYWDDSTEIVDDPLIHTPPPPSYVPIPLRGEMPPSVFAMPFRRVLGAPWFAVIVKIGSTGGEEIVLDTPSKTIGPVPWGDLYFYVNDAVVTLPFIYDWFYRKHIGTAKIRITNKGADAND